MPYAGFVNSIKPGIASIGNGILQGMNIDSHITSQLIRSKNASSHTRWACDSEQKNSALKGYELARIGSTHKRAVGSL